MVEGEAMMTVPRRLPHVKTGAVFMAWGGRFNYGHFLLDCLSSLAALHQAGLLKEARPVTPPLNAWQKESIRLLLGEKGAARVREIEAPVLRVDDVVFASPMDHFLHAPNRPLDWVREQMLAHVDLPDTGARRVYLSRRADDKRRMVNEEALEAEMVRRGFAIVYPQQLSVAAQIATFRDADIIVAPTGAALANTLFCKPGAKVFEIQPTNYAGIWVRGVCHLAQADWHGFFAPSPLQEQDMHLEGALRPGLSFEWLTPLDDFLAFLDARI
jgi:capsular polysaccharide biosynthesis protein